MLEPVELVAIVAVVAGVPLLILASYWFGGWRSAVIADADEARRAAAEEGDFRGGDVLLGEDGQAALLEEADGRRLALVRAVGDGLACRIFRAEDVRRAELRSARPADLEVALRDFTFPPVRIKLKHLKAAEPWLDRLRAARTQDADSS